MTRSELIRRRIVWHLRHVWRWCEGGNSWRSFQKLADELGVPVVSVKRETRRLARSGVVRHSVMCNFDGCPRGSGYFLSREWEEHRPGRAEDPTRDEFGDVESIDEDGGLTAEPLARKVDGVVVWTDNVRHAIAEARP